MLSSLFEPGRLRPCPSYRGRRDCITLGLLRSLYKGGGISVPRNAPPQKGCSIVWAGPGAQTRCGQHPLSTVHCCHVRFELCTEQLCRSVTLGQCRGPTSPPKPAAISGLRTPVWMLGPDPPGGTLKGDPPPPACANLRAQSLDPFPGRSWARVRGTLRLQLWRWDDTGGWDLNSGSWRCGSCSLTVRPTGFSSPILQPPVVHRLFGPE